ncbi:mitoferrin-1 isoform X1 [Neodiprion pinetum]|uniref:Mitoferrin-1 isoform X1 n=2 Tax=Neodiprion lecontei TaxID=441921 RepID=A0A6J0BFF2_NEOLC|nr:mitoferrin-1 isoform X1 [Neodiprion lecontei]XP_046435169.1 mitoferrin-1 isoform X1 [Neodiprion fabricii]XP_046491781.1 mitoferrin-1 isoform X1 [Neodiprion pinetum]XP_046628920.1 mitoferrin-1 isoform X1 [Neodiprion virginianus]
MNVDEYESLPTGSVAVHMTAGALAGIMEHCVMYPLDSVKTRMQALTPGPGGGGGVGAVLSRMVKQEGLLRPIRGMGAVVVGAGPAHALYFSCYEWLKDHMLGPRLPPQFNHLVYGAAGCVATVLHDGVMNPAEVVKQRLQMYNSPHRNVIECLRHVYKTEGIGAFYRSYTTQLAMNVPFQSIHFIAYEYAQAWTNPDHIYNPGAHMISGAMAGAIAAAATTPLDVCKTLLNTQQGGAQVEGMRDAFRTVYKFGGFQGYFRGLNARVLYQMPATAICWSTYEFFKYVLHGKQDDVQSLYGEVESMESQTQSHSSTTRPSSFQGASVYFNNQSPGPVLLDVTRS